MCWVYMGYSAHPIPFILSPSSHCQQLRHTQLQLSIPQGLSRIIQPTQEQLQQSGVSNEVQGGWIGVVV